MYDAEVHVVKLRDVVPGDFYVAKNDKRHIRTVIARADNKLMLLTGTGKIHVIPICAPPSPFTPGLASLSDSIVNVLRPVKR